MKSNLSLFWIIQISLIFLFIVVSNAQNIENDKEIPCQSTDINFYCLDDNNWHWVINNEKEYQRIVGGKTEIDFSKYTLIGVVYSSAGCTKPNTSHSIYFLEKGNTYRYELNVQQNGNCKALFAGNIWCLIPKIPNEMKVDFVKTLSVKQ